MLVPSSLIWSCTLAFAPCAEADGEDDRGDADEDAEHRQRRAQPVRADRFGRGAERVAPGHGRIQTVSSRRHRVERRAQAAVAHLDRRSARAAMSCSCVMSTIVRPSSWSSLEQLRARRRSSVESRLPVGSSARISAGSVTSARAIGDPLLLTAGQLARPVVGPVGRARPGRARRSARSRRSAGSHAAVDERQLDVAPRRRGRRAG